MTKRISIFRSSAIFAFALFGIANFSCAAVTGKKLDSDGALYKIHNYCKAPNSSAVFLGSSIAKHIASSLKDNSIGDLTYNLQMVSDSNILLREFIPQCVNQLVLIVSPRDFFDNDVPNQYETTTFKRCISLKKLPAYVTTYCPSNDAFNTVVWERLCPLFGKRGSIQTHLKATLHLNNVAFADSTNARKAERWQETDKEYRYRYDGITLEKLSAQMEFLDNLIRVARQRNTSVLIVNAPLSQSNINLLTEDLYHQFKTTLKARAEKSGADYLDLDRHFEDKSFADGVHLSSSGGSKALNMILDHINPRFVSKATPSKVY